MMDTRCQLLKTKKEMKSGYKSARTPSGVFQVRNVVNGKIFIGSAQNIPGILNSNRFQLNCGNHPSPSLQAEWKEFGAESFVFESLDELKVSEDNLASIRSELSLLERLWLEKLEPYGVRGYNERAE
jgi:hypothetical protein